MVYVNLKQGYDVVTPGDLTFGPYESVHFTAKEVEGIRRQLITAVATLNQNSGLWSFGQPKFGGGPARYPHVRITTTPDCEPQPQMQR